MLPLQKQEGNDLAVIIDKYRVDREDFESLISYQRDSGNHLNWDCIFVLPEWMKVWWTRFSNRPKCHLISIKKQETLLGLAPLQIDNHRASLVGSTDVCDYLDFIVSDGKETEFFEVLFDYLSRQNAKYLDLGLLRPDSTVLENLINVAQARGCKVTTQSEDIALELDLPATWDDYLGQLKGKQRHEIKRKLRRLNEAGEIKLRVVSSPEDIGRQLPAFFELFKLSSGEKAIFMTDRIRSFFRELFVTMADAGLLRLYVLELNAVQVAMSLCFDFNNTRHLYNSGFDPRFRALSVGLLCKVLSIKDAIEQGRRKYDFLKGAEVYKYRLGGREVPLYSCLVELP
jgi:CelD/BcsL family acetyltransferase involved in cellulose biosynthesis